MPSIPNLISGGISIGVLVSFISGVYYVLVAGYKWVEKLQASLHITDGKGADKWLCARCGRDLSRLKTGPGRRLQCARCSLSVCRNCCWKTSTSTWLCSSCRKYRDIRLQTGDWFYEQLRKRFYSTVATVPGRTNQDGEVRDFMERILEEMVGGELDNVSLRPLFIHPEYVKFCESYHDALVLLLAKFSLSLQMTVSDQILPDTDSPSKIHEDLKGIVQNIIREAMLLPSLKNYSNGSVNTDSINGEVDELEKRSYEDILATAVINKIVERYQNDLYDYEINNSSISNRRDSNSNVTGHRIKKRHIPTGPITGSNSSDSDGSVINDDQSWNSSCRSDPLSLTIEECIEEVITKYSADEDAEDSDSNLKQFLSGVNLRRRQRAPFPEFGMDVVDKPHSSASSSYEDDDIDDAEDAAIKVGVEIISPVESWEENWLFQKRRLKTACLSQSMPVPMLVPNPSEDEPRARIGDLDIDETSDLSDCSDSALEDLVDGSGFVNQRVTSKLGLSIDQEFSDENSEDEFYLNNYNNNAIKSIDKNIKPNKIGVCNGKIGDNKLIKLKNCNNNNNNEDECMTTEMSSSGLSGLETSSTSSSNIVEAKNQEFIIPQVDSGEGSLEIQNDRDYTVEYDAPVQLDLNNKNSHLTESSLNRSITNCTQHYLQNNNSTINKICEPGHINSDKPTPESRCILNVQKESINMDQSNGVLNNEVKYESQESLDDVMITPPRPGTIAEREYLKWQKAAPLVNNPYSKENIERRRRDRLLLSRSCNDVSVEFPELTGANNSSVMHIDCSGGKADFKQYGRDYYINNGGKKINRINREREKSLESNISKTKSFDTSNSTNNNNNMKEDKPQVSVRVEVEVGRWSNSRTPTSSNNNPVVSSSIETRTCVTNLKEDEHLTTVSTSTVSSVDNKNNDDNCRKVTTVSSWNESKDKTNFITLPSVKELAKQFSSTENLSQIPPINLSGQKRLGVQNAGSPIKQVHSLTARCISKEFREGLKGVNQLKNSQSKSVEKNNSGYISDDSGTVSPTPSSGCNPKLYNSIAFWEQLKTSRE